MTHTDAFKSSGATEAKTIPALREMKLFKWVDLGTCTIASLQSRFLLWLPWMFKKRDKNLCESDPSSILNLNFPSESETTFHSLSWWFSKCYRNILYGNLLFPHHLNGKPLSFLCCTAILLLKFCGLLKLPLLSLKCNCFLAIIHCL